MARYKGYKIPLSQLRTGKFTKKLHEAGSRIIATPEQATSLEAIKDLLVISKTERPTVDESEAAKSVENLKDFLNTLSGVPTEDGPAEAKSKQKQKQLAESTTLAHDLAELLGEELDGDEFASPQAKAAKRRKVDEEKAAIELIGKFVNVTDILPPLPKRGNFKVEMIKGSQYFFS
jgi:DNA-directed RNA polymerase